MKSQDFEQDLYCNLFFTVKIFKPKFLAKASSLAFSDKFFDQLSTATETMQNRCNFKLDVLKFLSKLNEFYGFNSNKGIKVIVLFYFVEII